MKNDYLEHFTVKLTALSPVHVGSGQVIQKRNYYFDGRNGEVTFYNMEKLFSILAEKGKADTYEEYVFSKGNQSLRDLYVRCQMRKEDFSSAELCTVSAAGAIDDLHSLKEIHQFVRTADYLPYIPGSSLKGALRTIYLHSIMDEGSIKKYELKNIDDKRKDKVAASGIEDKLLGTLPLNKEKKDSNFPLRDVMRGLSVSDSAPLSNGDMILAGKLDTDGDKLENTVNVVRECIRPGTVIRFAVSVDTSILSLGKKELMKAVSDYFEYYQNTFLKMFYGDGFDTLPKQEGCCMLLGGGNGYFSKSIVYKTLGFKPALDYVSGYMQRTFKGHYHEEDKDFGLSPHMLKCTKYDGRKVQIGWCRMEIEDS